VFKSLPFYGQSYLFQSHATADQTQFNIVLYSYVLYVMPLSLFGDGSMGTLSYDKYLYVVYPIPT
jgi:hypothetical protein